ncbi:hypothetical protein A8C32_18150 [Flavivirga aquatica]|uniref:Uncharacterized protein n=1 Tax=Flavivirga aquatica TaxID=1849968 RepID=A0A1E5T7K4_9FLAO|nr:hypothetical protein [Flavivirga aquatica]OEK07359.1 hypothetical protein A8C32_18150 [Flavivirga aquatica]
MKVKLFYIAFFLFCSVKSIAQQFPVLVDPGSMTGSVLSWSLYSMLSTEDKNNRKKIIAFKKDLAKRHLYLVEGAIVVNKINREISNCKERYRQLEHRNKSLSFLSYSKKKINNKMLNLVNVMLENINKGLKNQRALEVLYGEKLNLLQNTMKSLTEIYRVLDVVEDNIEKTKLYNRIFN